MASEKSRLMRPGVARPLGSRSFINSPGEAVYSLPLAGVSVLGLLVEKEVDVRVLGVTVDVGDPTGVFDVQALAETGHSLARDGAVGPVFVGGVEALEVSGVLGLEGENDVVKVGRSGSALGLAGEVAVGGPPA
jgi:hypothetical protein